MKRFLIDACLLLILICIGSYVQHRVEGEQFIYDVAQVEEKIDAFEESVATHEILPTSSIKDKENENRAARIAKTSSNVIVSMVKGTTSIVFKIFDEVIK